MNFRPGSIENEIIRELAARPQRTTELLKSIQVPTRGTTKQGFYAALRKLKSEEVIVLYKKTVALNTTWLKSMREFFTSAETAYTGSLPSIDILTLNDKESISYSFASIQQLDVFWGHAQNIVVHATPANEAVYTYDPHYWFFIGRPDSEPRLIDEIASLGKQFLMTVGYSTPLDRVLQRHFTDDMRQYHMQKMFEDDSYYVVVIGDYIFEARLDQATVERIQSVYARTESPYETAALELRQIPNIKARARLKVSRNKSRAHQLKGRLEKNFYVKR